MDQVSNEKKEAKKVWFNKNWKKIVFSLALVGATTGTIGLVLGSISLNKTNELSYFLKPDYTAVWGKGFILVEKDSFSLYFVSKLKVEDYKKLWNGKYPKGYFNDEKVD